MRERVGLARALVVDPDLLLMGRTHSSGAGRADRGERAHRSIDLWSEGKLRVKSF